MKKLIYEIEGWSHVYNEETEEVEKVPARATVTVKDPTDRDIEKAKQRACNGAYRIETEEDPVSVAPRNIIAGEYITADGILYKATANIPNGCAIVPGQNAVRTTIEEQLHELSKGE